MTGYNTIADGDIDPDSPVTTSLLTYLRDNPIAITEKAAGAPVLANSYVVQGILKSTTGAVSTTSITDVNLTLPGGQYGFYPQLKSTPPGTATWGYQYGTASINSATYTALASMRTSNASYAAYIRHRYIQASPPYDLGDGEIPLFIFAAIDNNTKKVVSAYAAPEAPWHYNGPTDIRADRYAAGGRSFQNKKDMADFPFTYEQSKKDPIKHLEYIAAFKSALEVEREITQEIKNADMALIPSPFNPLAGQSIVMLDPVAPLLLGLTENMKHAEFNIADLLHNGDIVIGNSALKRAGPPGVDVVSCRMR